MDKKDSQLTILPVRKDAGLEYHLTWKLMFLSVDTWVEHIVFIDAVTGEIWRHHKGGAFLTGSVDGYVWPEDGDDTKVTRAFKYERVKTYKNGSQSAWSVTDVNGNFPYVEGADSVFSRLDLSVTQNIPYIWVKNNSGGGKSDDGVDNEIEYAKSGDYSIFDWTWPDDATGPGTPDSVKADEVNVFWHANDMYKYFSGFGYSNTPAVKIFVNCGETVGASTSSDGDEIYFGTKNYTGYANDKFARDSDAINHEYTHSVIGRIYGEKIETKDLVSGTNPQGAAMDEGFSDYSAVSKNNFSGDTRVAEWIYGANNPSLRDLSNSLTMSDFSSDSSAHYNGQIISGACWDLRQDPQVGQTKGDRILFNALTQMEETTGPYDFEDFHDQVYMADYNLYDDGDGLDNGTPHASDIWDAFKEGAKDRAISTTLYDSEPPRDGNPKIVASSLPKHFSLSQNHPNPFNPTTMISFTVPRSSQVRLSIYNTLGQVVWVVADGKYEEGVHNVRWDGTDGVGREVASGIYLYRLEGKDFVQTRRMVLLR